MNMAAVHVGRTEQLVPDPADFNTMQELALEFEDHAGIDVGKLQTGEIVTASSTTTLSIESMHTQPPKIQRVPEILLLACTINPSNGNCYKEQFTPRVVSVGPYHHGAQNLRDMERHKEASLEQFVLSCGVSVEEIRAIVGAIAAEARQSYVESDAALVKLSEKEFIDMMVRDGCFVLHFINTLAGRNNSGLTIFAPDSEITVSAHLHGSISRDLFLLENQIPFLVLRKLLTVASPEKATSATPGNGDHQQPHDNIFVSFIDKLIGSDNNGDAAYANGHKALHLLDLLRSRLVGDEMDKRAVANGNGGASSAAGSWHRFRSVMELKEAGISIERSQTRHLTDIQFQPGFPHGRLTLPQFVVDDITKARFLNLIALEMCPGKMHHSAASNGSSSYSVTSYVCFLDKLIDHAEDVKELRQKEVLLNFLGSDQQVADLFNQLAIDLAPDLRLYDHVIQGINEYYNNSCRVSIVRMLNTHFSSPWSAISFVAASLLLIMTLIQTIFAIKG